MQRTASPAARLNSSNGYDPDMVDAAPAPRIVAIIPIGSLENAKSRLGGTLDAEERRDLAEAMIARTIAASTATPGIAETLVVSPDLEAIERAASLGTRTIRQRGQGLNAGLREARDDAIAGGADAIAILPIDLPLISPEAIGRLIAPLRVDGERPLVVLAPDRHHRGTNGLLLAPPDAIEPSFGGDSRAAHEACARDAGARYVEVDGPLGLDLDTPDDLLFVESLVDDPIAVLETADAG
jgi:2-phospho-L-lactate/phosphoenolpyruvate guanylyltransferase